MRRAEEALRPVRTVNRARKYTRPRRSSDSLRSQPLEVELASETANSPLVMPRFYTPTEDFMDTLRVRVTKHAAFLFPLRPLFHD
jgi:hypothetical protein